MRQITLGMLLFMLFGCGELVVVGGDGPQPQGEEKEDPDPPDPGCGENPGWDYCVGSCFEGRPSCVNGNWECYYAAVSPDCSPPMEICSDAGLVDCGEFAMLERYEPDLNCYTYVCDCPAGWVFQGGRCLEPEPPPAAGLVLDPHSIYEYDLPIDSIRRAYTGYDPQSQTCVTFIWQGESFPGPTRCSEGGAGQDGMSVVIRPSQFFDQDAQPCRQCAGAEGSLGPCWEAQGDTQILSVTGCADFPTQGFGADALPHPGATPAIDLTVQVEGLDFTGTILANNHEIFEAKPFVIGLEYLSDVPEDFLVTPYDDTGAPGWFTPTPCPDCDSCEGACDPLHLAPALPEVGPINSTEPVSITGGTNRGEIYYTWYGYHWSGDLRGQAGPGSYAIEYCYQYAYETLQLECQTLGIEYPDDGSAILRINAGG